MLAIIHFNKDCPGWTEDPEIRECIVMNNIMYFHAKLAAGRSVYLSEIFDRFGAEMSEDDYNCCFDAKNERIPSFVYQRMDDGEINIRIIY